MVPRDAITTALEYGKYLAGILGLVLTLTGSLMPALGEALALRFRKRRKDADLPQGKFETQGVAATGDDNVIIAAQILKPRDEHDIVACSAERIESDIDVGEFHEKIESAMAERVHEEVDDIKADDLVIPAQIRKRVEVAREEGDQHTTLSELSHRITLALAVLGVVAISVGAFIFQSFKGKPPSQPPFAAPSGMWTLISWLSRHEEAFYQFLFLFVVVSVVLLNKRRIAALVRRLDASGQLLLGFAGIVFCFGVSAGIHFWNQISVSGDKMYLALGLFLTMVAGMFVQVITSNYKAGASSLFAVTTAQLVYPVLFSPIVYYAIWAVASASTSAGLFSFYAAFLNGYFWQSVVTSAQKASAASGTA